MGMHKTTHAGRQCRYADTLHGVLYYASYYAPPLIGGALSDDFV